MTEQTTQDGLSVQDIDKAYHVLETLRENFHDDDMEHFEKIVNEAHYLVQQYEQNADWSDDYDLPEVGDVVVDTESNPKFGDGRVEVVDVLETKESRIHYVDKPHGKVSVAHENPNHPSDAPVVLGQYVDGSKKVYAFPVTRLQ